jgi:hypothetical protein
VAGQLRSNPHRRLSQLLEVMCIQTVNTFEGYYESIRRRCLDFSSLRTLSHKQPNKISSVPLESLHSSVRMIFKTPLIFFSITLVVHSAAIPEDQGTICSKGCTGQCYDASYEADSFVLDVLTSRSNRGLSGRRTKLWVPSKYRDVHYVGSQPISAC